MYIMNINLLKSIIKECVREGVREELESLFGGNPQPTVKPPVSTTKTQSLREMLSTEEVETPSAQIVEKRAFKKYTNNEMLNQILNETRALQQDGPLVSGMNESEIITKSDNMLKIIQESNPQAANVLNNVFTKDYSKLLKTIDRKAKDPSLKSKINLVTA